MQLWVDIQQGCTLSKKSTLNIGSVNLPPCLLLSHKIIWKSLATSIGFSNQFLRKRGNLSLTQDTKNNRSQS